MPPKHTRRLSSNIKAVKDEEKGFITLDSSTSNGTDTPKEEHTEVNLSDINQAKFDSFSHDGLPRDIDEGYATQPNQDFERNMRSPGPSFRTSRQPSRRRESMDFTAVSAEAGEGLQIVGQKVNMLVGAIENLRALGLKELDTVLPELVLVGDQSAGKSTLLGAIAGINLPRSDGMCTKVPANVKTSPDNVWSCTVSLTEYYSYPADGKKKPGQEFPPWEPKSDGPTKKHFRTISNKSELENVLRLAQAALLNPGHDLDSFLPGSGINVPSVMNNTFPHKADFSPNLITIEISGPLLPALSLYDLPGNFVNPEELQQTYLVKTFEKLSKSYMERENALVICAMSMHIDPGLSKTRGLIAKLHAEDRCVGVLTMPDRMQTGASSTDYDKILRGRAHILKHGYFITKQPGPDFRCDGKDYHARAREEEAEFFDSDMRWTGEWKEFSDRCGTGAIQEYLSQELAAMIVRSMPDIEKKIAKHSQVVDAALRALPALPGQNVQHVVRSRLQMFSNGVQRMMEGGPANGSFLSSWDKLNFEFRDAILAMRPMFTPADSSDMDLPEVIDIMDDSDDDRTVPLSTPNTRKRPAEDFVTPTGERLKIGSGSFSRESSVSAGRSNQPKHEGTSPGSPTPAHRPQGTPGNRAFASMRPPQSRRPQTPSQPRRTVFEQFMGKGRKFMTIGDIRLVIAQHRLPGVPDDIPHAAKEDICLQSVTPWNEPMEVFANHTFSLLSEAVLGMLHQFLGDYKQTELFRASHRQMRSFLETQFRIQMQNIRSFYELETYKLFTINSPMFDVYQAEELRVLQEARRKRRAVCYIKKQLTMSNRQQSKTQFDAAVAAVKEDHLSPDSFASEIKVAAYVRGYYKTAGLRFADNICQSVQGHLFRQLNANIMGLLEGYLKLNEGDGEATCRMLMVEDENEGKQRTELQSKKEKWTVAAASLKALFREYTMENPLNYNPEDVEMDYGHATPHDSTTPSVSASDARGIVMGRPSPAH